MKYIDTEKLITEIKIIQQSLENRDVYGNQIKKIRTECMIEFCKCIFDAIDSLQQEQPMPDSTKLIEIWHEDKEMLKEKDFRDDPWRLAYNAFMCGFGRGIAVNKQEQPEVDLDFRVFCKEMDAVFNLPKEVTENTEENPLNWEYAIARHFWNKGYNARKK